MLYFRLCKSFESYYRYIHRRTRTGQQRTVLYVVGSEIIVWKVWLFCHGWIPFTHGSRSNNLHPNCNSALVQYTHVSVCVRVCGCVCLYCCCGGELRRVCSVRPLVILLREQPSACSQAAGRAGRTTSDISERPSVLDSAVNCVLGRPAGHRGPVISPPGRRVTDDVVCNDDDDDDSDRIDVQIQRLQCPPLFVVPRSFISGRQATPHYFWLGCN